MGLGKVSKPGLELGTPEAQRQYVLPMPIFYEM